VTHQDGIDSETATPPPVVPASDPELAAWLAATYTDLTTEPAEPEAADEDLDPFTASYLDHRASQSPDEDLDPYLASYLAHQASQTPDAATGTEWSQAPDWGPDTSADLW